MRAAGIIFTPRKRALMVPLSPLNEPLYAELRLFHPAALGSQMMFVWKQTRGQPMDPGNFLNSFGALK